MMDEFDYKTCPECSERIPHLAKKCPFCKSFQGGRWKVFRNPAFVGVLPGLAFLLFVIPNMGKTLNRPSYLFMDFVSQVPVTSSNMYFETTNGRRTVTVIGTIRNDTNIPWESLSMEVQFYDKAGKRIDVVEDFYSSRMLTPHGEHAFRISGAASKPIAGYASHKVFLRHASDVDHFSR